MLRPKCSIVTVQGFSKVPQTNFQALGPTAEEIVAEDRDTIRKERQRLLEAENQLKQVEAISAEKEKPSQELQN